MAAKLTALLTSAALLGSVLVATPVPVLAQTSNTAAPPAAETVTPKHARAGRNRVANVEEYIQSLHGRLGITATQEPQWAAVAQVMRDNAASIDGLVRARAKSARSMTAVDDLRSYEQLAAAHEAGLQKLIPVFQTLYDGMNDQQKKTCDAVFQKNQRRMS